MSNSGSYSGWRFDILKLVLSLFVVALHTYPLPLSYEPVYRIAVPLFFIMSSYFFFRGNQDVKHYVSRNAKLYLFWMLALLAPTIFIGGYRNLIEVVRNLFFYETFRASWFIMALIIGVPSVFWLGKKNKCCVVLLASAAYIIALLSSTYSFVIENNDVLLRGLYAIRVVIPFPEYSFLVSLIWILIGRSIAERRIILKTPLIVVVALVGLVLYIMECRFVKGPYYFSLLLLCPMLFLLVMMIPERTSKDLKWCRRASTILYCSHHTVAILVATFTRHMLSYEFAHMLLYAATTAICLVLTFVIIKLSKYKGFKWLRYAY